MISKKIIDILTQPQEVAPPKSEYTREDIEKLGLYNPIVANAMQLHRAGMLTWEQATYLMIADLAKVNANLFEALSRSQQPPVFVIQKDDRA